MFDPNFAEKRDEQQRQSFGHHGLLSLDDDCRSRTLYITNVMVKAPAGSRDIVNLPRIFKISQYSVNFD